jgi:hypothetical protein
MADPNCGALQEILGMCGGKKAAPVPTTRYTGPQPTSRFPSGVKRATPPPPAPKKTTPQPVSRFEGIDVNNFTKRNPTISKVEDIIGTDLPQWVIPAVAVIVGLGVVYFILR